MQLLPPRLQANESDDLEKHRPQGQLAKKTVVFLSSCPEVWGGSEELWNGAALRFAASGHRICVVKTLVDASNSNIRRLKQSCEKVEDYHNHRDFTLRLLRKLFPHRWLPQVPDLSYPWLCRFLRKQNPDLVVVSQGENFDGINFATACHQSGVPYVLIVQKATDSNWPSPEMRPLMRRAYELARRVYFVCEHNRELTECQIGFRLSHAEVVRNPFLTKVDGPLPWPQGDRQRFKLACLARVFIEEKGQDILLKVLAQEKWKARPVELNFFGKGIHREALEEMAKLLGLTNVKFAGFTADVTGVWKEHHALVLSSRCEGLPLSVIEAMLCGRPVIVTDVGGSAEIIDDNRTGFVAKAATVQAFDEALERAWQRRHEWQSIGECAAESVRTHVPPDPCAVFAAKIMELC